MTHDEEKEPEGEIWAMKNTKSVVQEDIQGKGGIR